MKQTLRHIFLLVALFAAIANLSAQTFNGGTWYSLYELGERTLSTIDSETLNAFTPVGTNLTFDAKRDATGQGNLKVAPIVNGNQQSNIFDQKPGKVTKKNFLGIESKVDYTDAPYSANVSNPNSNQIKFYTVTGATLKKYYKNVKLPLAKHILLNDNTSNGQTWGVSAITLTDNSLATAEGKTSTSAYTIRFRSFLASGDITIKSSNPEFHFGNGQTSITLGVANNYCASTNGSGNCSATTLGQISNYSKQIYFSPAVQYNKNTRSTTITISDGTSTAYIYLSAPVVPTYFFKAEAIASPAEGGTATATFSNGQDNCSVIATNYATTSMSATVTFTAAPNSANGYVFEGWKTDPASSTFYKQGANQTSFTETITSSALNPNGLTSQKTYYAIYSRRYTAKITGSNYTNKLVNDSWKADYQFVNTQSATPTNSDADPFYFKIEHNFTGNDTREGSPRPDEVIAYDPTTNTITALNEGTATITFYQKNTDSHESVSESFTVQVIKHTPVFTLNPAVTNSPEKLYFNKEYPDYFTTNANSPLTITSSDELVAKWEQGSNSQSYTLKTFSKTNPATLTAIQHENYYWQRLEGAIEIQLQDSNNHVPFTIDTQEKRDLFDVYSNASPYTWDNGIQMGNWENGGSWADKYVDLHFTGIPNKLGFSTSVKEAGNFPATDIYWYVKESEDGVNWSSEIWNNKETKNITITDSIQLNPKTRYVRLCYSGNFGCVFHDVTVTEREEFYASEVDKENKITELNFNIDPNGDPKENQVGIPHSLSFDFHYANVGYDVKLSTNDPDHFTISKTSLKNIGGEKVGKETITVTYSAPEKYTAENKELYITDELGNTYTIALTASTVKATQTLTWQGVYAAEKPVVRINEGTISNLATASSGLQVTYRSSDESIIKVSDDSLSLIPQKMADAVEITAVQKGNNVWNEVKETKTFRITDKLTQLILWPNTLSDLVIDGENIALDAKVYVVDDETGEYTFSESLTSNLHYEVENTNIVAIEDGVLKIKGIGETYLTVTAPGNTDYAEASLTVLVRVRAEAAGCEDYLLNSYHTNDELRYFQMNLDAIQYEFDIDRTYGEPDYITLQHRGVAWGLSFGGSFEVYYETVESTQLQTATPRFSPEEDKTGTETIDLPRNATKFYIKRLAGATGYHYLSNIQVHPAQYVETNVSEINFGNIYVGSQVTQTFTVNYCNIKSELYTQPSSSDVQVSPTSFGGCNAYDSQSVTISWTPKSVHENEQTVTITDPVSGKSASVRIFAAVLKGKQTLEWVAPEQIDACGQLCLPNETDEHIALDWTVVAGQQYADFENGMLAIKGNGTITLRASNSGSENYNAFQKDYQIKVVYNPIFLGSVDNDWNNPNNWNVGHLPSETDVVTMQAPAVLKKHIIVGGLVFSNGGSMQILSNGGLTVGAHGITGDKEDGSTITIDNTPDGAGFLKVDPTTDKKPVKVTINYTTKAFNSGNPRDEIWQYMGAPGNDMQMSDANNTMIYHWNEQQGWLKMSNTSLQPFVGYAFTQNKAQSANFQIQATPIIPDKEQEIMLTLTQSGMRGSNLFVNSFLAPIDLATFDNNDFTDGVEQTFYLYNSGTWNQWQSNGGATNQMTGDGTSPGQYYAITPGSAAMIDASQDQTTIPPMQGVYVVTQKDGAKIYLDYAKHVYKADASNQAMRAPQRQDDNFKRVRLQVNSQNSGADRMYVIQHNECTSGYDNGYDAKNMPVASQVSIYTTEADGQMEISVSDNIDSTYIGFNAGADTEYTLRMTSVVGERLYLKDLDNQTLISVYDGEEYTFSAEPNSVNDRRFLLLDQRSDDVSTDEPEVRVYVYDKMAHVLGAPIGSDMVIYTIGGVAITNYTIECTPSVVDLSSLPTGVYVLRINDKAFKCVCK